MKIVVKNFLNEVMRPHWEIRSPASSDVLHLGTWPQSSVAFPQTRQKSSNTVQPQRDHLRSVGIGVQETPLATVWCSACWTGFWITPSLDRASFSSFVGRFVRVETIP